MNTSTVMAGVLVLAIGYVAGRVRPWRSLACWAEDDVRFSGPWACGGQTRQAVVVAALVRTAPVATWRSLCKGRYLYKQAEAPQRDPHWIAKQLQKDEGGSA
ncbi:hypothetical protein ACFC1B_07520 [Streptomyces xiamenensis]|uniref:hypothetical protein n=1 Tax=Streptomyces xiamenensis TaxID=408015 RepID=UPI0035D80F0F